MLDFFGNIQAKKEYMKYIKIKNTNKMTAITASSMDLIIIYYLLYY